MNNTLDLRNPDAVCALLGLTEAPEIWRRSWPQSAGSFVPGGVFFLTPEYVAQTCATLRICPELATALADCAGTVAGEPALQRLVWHLHWLISLSGIDPAVGSWPGLEPEGHPANALLYGLIVLAGLPRALEINAARGIDPEDTIETLSDLQTWATDYHNARGVWRLVTLGWIQHHLRGHLFKLGRLEYIPGKYDQPFRWYRQIATGKVVALAEDGLLLRQDGQFASADRGAVREGLWKTRFVETLEAVTGSPVSPLSRVLPEPVTLSADEWLEILRPGDPVITVHIPSKGGMGPQECGASFVRAVEFYRKLFPDVVWRALTCHSWLLDPQFEQLSPAPPNICAFEREWYLHPVENADDAQHFQRMFDLFGPYGQVRWGEVEAKSSLQRAMLEFVKAGGHPRSGGSVLFAEDLDWGKAVYRGERKPDFV